MESALQWLLIVGVLALMGGVGYLAYRAQEKRRAELMAFASNRGWSYDPRKHGLDADAYRGQPFNAGKDPQVANMVAGLSDGLPIRAFDYTYVTESRDGKGNTSRTTHRYAICALGLPAYLPQLCVSTENVLTRMGSAIGIGDDIKLESDAFNRRFRVSAKDRKFASDVLHPRTMERLLAQRALPWRIDGPQIVLWEGGRISPVRVLEHAALLHSVVSAIPTFVWRDHGAQLPGPEGTR